MGEGNQSVESRIEARDEETPSPEVRAGFILNLLKDTNNDLTNWDILCFVVEFLASQVMVYSWLDQKSVRELTTKVYQAHYFRDEIPETGIFK